MPRPPDTATLAWCAARQWRTDGTCRSSLSNFHDPAPKSLVPGVHPWHLPDGQLDPHREPFWAVHEAAVLAAAQEAAAERLYSMSSGPGSPWATSSDEPDPHPWAGLEDQMQWAWQNAHQF